MVIVIYEKYATIKIKLILGGKRLTDPYTFGENRLFK